MSEEDRIVFDGSTIRAGQRNRGLARDPAREEPVREAARDNLRDDEVLGRNGEVLSRKRQGGVDLFRVPPEIIPEGWDYQWNVVSVTGNSEIVMDQANGMYENGWRPVPAERHPGVFLARGKTGEIIRGGQRLEERPMSLSMAARDEEVRLAQQQMRDRDQSLMGIAGRAMNNGFEMRNKISGSRMSIDREGAPRPSYKLAEPGE